MFPACRQAEILGSPTNLITQATKKSVSALNEKLLVLKIKSPVRRLSRLNSQNWWARFTIQGPEQFALHLK